MRSEERLPDDPPFFDHTGDADESEDEDDEVVTARSRFGVGERGESRSPRGTRRGAPEALIRLKRRVDAVKQRGRRKTAHNEKLTQSPEGQRQPTSSGPRHHGPVPERVVLRSAALRHRDRRPEASAGESLASLAEAAQKAVQKQVDGQRESLAHVYQSGDEVMRDHRAKIYHAENHSAQKNHAAMKQAEDLQAEVHHTKIQHGRHGPKTARPGQTKEVKSDLSPEEKHFGPHSRTDEKNLGEDDDLRESLRDEDEQLGDSASKNRAVPRNHAHGSTPSSGPQAGKGLVEIGSKLAHHRHSISHAVRAMVKNPEDYTAEERREGDGTAHDTGAIRRMPGDHCIDGERDEAPKLNLDGKDRTCDEVKDFCTGNEQAWLVARKCPFSCQVCVDRVGLVNSPHMDYGDRLTECSRRRQAGFCYSRRRRGD